MKKMTTSCFRAFVAGGLLTMAGLAQAQMTTTTTTSAGTISSYTPDAMTIRTETSAAPVSYTFSKTTTYVDENGNPVSVETVKSGLPVTVYYERDGDSLVATKVVVHKVTTTSDVSAPPPADATTTTVKKTTTTTVNP